MAAHTNRLPRDEDPADTETTQDRYLGTADLTHWGTPGGRGLAKIAHRLSAKLGYNGALVAFLALGLLVAVALSLAAAQVYDNITDADGVAGLDRPLLQWAVSLRTPIADAAVTGFTQVAGPVGMPVIAVAALIVLSLRRRSWTPALLIVTAGGGSLLMTVVGKPFFDRVRPPLSSAVPPYEYSGSFPSGHTLNAVAVVGIIAYLLVLRQRGRRARTVTIVAAVMFALAVGLSRVFLGHHWFTDVLASWLLGAAWLLLVITAHRLYLTIRNRDHRLLPLGPTPGA